jgi:hypothetical protein
MPDFKTELDRREWIVANANYFTVLNYAPWGNSQRLEFPTLELAEQAAQRIIARDKPARPLMIYAVAGIHDTWVKNVGVGYASNASNSVHS